MHRKQFLLIAFVYLSSGCTSFATVRSADVYPGLSAAVQASATTSTGDVAGWFWAFDCAGSCDHTVVGGDIGFTYGWPREEGGRPIAVGVGLSGLYPYVDGYLQLAKGTRPFGLGARLGLPSNWREHQLYARYDVRLGENARLLLNPALFIHEGRAPNGASPGSFVGFVQGVGILFQGKRVSFTPGVALVSGVAQRNSYGQKYGPERSTFATASAAITFHR